MLLLERSFHLPDQQTQHSGQTKRPAGKRTRMDLIQIRNNREPIRVFPERNKWTPIDPLAFVGFPPFEQFRPADPKTPVHVSVTFTWHRAHARELADAWRGYY